MPVLQTYQLPAFEVLIWNITEPLSFFVEALELTNSELLLLQQKYRNPIAFQQWLASRCGLQQVFKTSHRAFQKNEAGKLELKNTPYQLSLSHSDSYIAVAKSKQAVGLDLQVRTPKLERIASKYLAAELLVELKKSPNYIDYLHIYWGIKEALFKAYGLGKVDFIKHLHIEAFDNTSKGNTRAVILKPNFKASYQVFYEKTTNYYLCVVTKE
jgi:phosphopantetheinyl transferase